MACNTNALALALLVGPATLALASPYAIDDSKGLGLRWEGVGAISGGGATTKLLMDYDKTIVSDILDFMFKPNFVWWRHAVSHTSRTMSIWLFSAVLPVVKNLPFVITKCTCSWLSPQGLNLDILKVEIGGDTDATEGAEPSHM